MGDLELDKENHHEIDRVARNASNERTDRQTTSKLHYFDLKQVALVKSDEGFGYCCLKIELSCLLVAFTKEKERKQVDLDVTKRR